MCLAAKDMVKSKWGRIVNIGSSSAYFGHGETSLYCASKHALLGFSRSIHDELKQFNLSKKYPIEKFPNIRFFLGDVRDKDRLKMAFHEVDYVIHAAALKQVPIA